MYDLQAMLVAELKMCLKKVGFALGMAMFIVGGIILLLTYR